MAKKARPFIQLVCQECHRRNYTTTKSRLNKSGGPAEKLELKKYCPQCKKHTQHKETKIPKPQR